MTSSRSKTIACAIVTLLSACGSPEPSEAPESSGAGAVAGGNAGSGDAGSTNAGTAGATEMSGGVAGGGAAGAAASENAGTAGTQPTAGTPFGPVGSECATEDDCRLVSDCCRCVAAPKGVTLDVCYASCAETMCIAGGVTGSERVCVNGRCVLDRSCDRSRVTCDVAPPECESGMIPSVDGDCYGACIASTECRD